MIAEIYGKISSTGSNLSDRLEDKLTGDIFGTLRYLPFDLGIGPILSAAHSLELSELMAENASPAYKMHFWPYHPDGELDVRIDLDNAIIGIEVKYQSPLSSDDEADYSNDSGEEVDKFSDNQLSRESRIVRDIAGPFKKAFLVLVASDRDCTEIICDVTGRNLIEDSVELGYISWQDVLLILKQQHSGDALHTCILEDMVALLEKKGFDKFHGFNYPMPDVDVGEYFSYQFTPNSGFEEFQGFNYPVPDVYMGGQFFYQRIPSFRIQFPDNPLIECGEYYEFG